MENPKLVRLLKVVVENYISKGEPVGSKFLHTLEDNEYAPSTLRKHLNTLEKEGLVFQSYNSSGRIPTIS
jgi:heat-inducible transcriptional repressor